jgi:pimeloyl-ACP methyl ester carboxylesterase
VCLPDYQGALSVTPPPVEYVEVAGLRFACQRTGDPAAPAIILIRGLGTQLIEWSPLLLQSLVAGGLQVIVFDNRDVGLSSKLDRGYRLQDMAADVVGLLEALQIERAHVFGISLGGMVAQLVAVDFPERVRCLFSVMSSSGNPELPAAAPEVRAKMLEPAVGRDAIIALDASNRALFGSPGFPESEATRLAMATRVYDRCYYPQGVARQMEAALADGSRVARLARISAPTLVIHGADDPLLLPQCGEDTARHIPGAELQLIPGMGHNIPDALAPDIAARVLAFINRH